MGIPLKNSVQQTSAISMAQYLHDVSTNGGEDHSQDMDVVIGDFVDLGLDVLDPNVLDLNNIKTAEKKGKKRRNSSNLLDDIKKIANYQHIFQGSNSIDVGIRIKRMKEDLSKSHLTYEKV